MGFGTPVVISDLPSAGAARDRVHIWQEIEAALARWITSCEVEKLTTSLKLAWRSPNERKQRGNNGRQLVKQKYSWSAIANKTIQVYRDLVV